MCNLISISDVVDQGRIIHEYLQHPRGHPSDHRFFICAALSNTHAEPNGVHDLMNERVCFFDRVLACSNNDATLLAVSAPEVVGAKQ